jgi:hypothetical protein
MTAQIGSTAWTLRTGVLHDWLAATVTEVAAQEARVARDRREHKAVPECEPRPAGARAAYVRKLIGISSRQPISARFGTARTVDGHQRAPPCAVGTRSVSSPRAIWRRLRPASRSAAMRRTTSSGNCRRRPTGFGRLGLFCICREPGAPGQATSLTGAGRCRGESWRGGRLRNGRATTPPRGHSGSCEAALS